MVQLPRWQRILIIIVLVIGALYALPNMLPRSTLEKLPHWLPTSQINLGLDLRGGSYMLLEVDLNALEQEQLKDLAAQVRVLLTENKIGFTNLGVRGNAVTFSLRDASQAAAASTALSDGLTSIRVSDNGAGLVSLAYDDAYLEKRRTSVISQALEIVRRRIDETGTREPSIQRQGDLRILVQVPGLQNPDELKALLGTTAKLSFRFVLENLRPGVDPIPAGASVMETEQKDAAGNPLRIVVEDRVMVSGESLQDAQLAYNGSTPVVSFRFDAIGGRRFCDATRDNVNRLFAIVLDNKVISFPRINEPICGGSGQISGNFTQKTATDLAVLLRAGALPAPLTIIEERTIGPGLGEDSVAAGQTAAVISGILVVVFMLLAYGLFGLYANIALLGNLILLMGAMTALQATLTLPGIAGIALTLGVAVDANVLIFERMREEIRNGRSVAMAVDAGFKRAMATIIDSNLTHLIAGVVLFQFGTGPIKGFAVTLLLGILTSLFSAVMLTHWMLVAWLRRKKRVALPI